MIAIDIHCPKRLLIGPISTNMLSLLFENEYNYTSNFEYNYGLLEDNLVSHASQTDSHLYLTKELLNQHISEQTDASHHCIPSHTPNISL